MRSITDSSSLSSKKPMPRTVTCCTIVRCAGSAVGGCFSGPTRCVRSWPPSLESKGFSFPELRDPAWCCDFAFAVDLTGHLNTLNTSLQMKNLLVSDMVSKIKTFCVKLMLWEGQLCGGDFSHFERLASCDSPQRVVGRYADVIGALKKEFVGRFKDFDASSQPLQLCSTPFDVDPTDVGSDLQMELIELHCDEQLKSRFVAMTPLDFWRSQALTFPRLADNARRVAALFGSTDVCEQLFSRMKLVKSRTRAPTHG